MNFAEQLKSQIDIVKVIGEYVRLKRAGASGRYVGLCPFHQEKTPSFAVNQTRQFYKCFGCGEGGDVFKFVMEIDRLHVSRSAEDCSPSATASRCRKRNEYTDAESKLRAALLEIHAIAAKSLSDALRAAAGRGGAGLSCATRRQCGADRDVRAGICRAVRDRRWFARLSQERFTPEQLEASALVRRRDDGSHLRRVPRAADVSDSQ